MSPTTAPSPHANPRESILCRCNASFGFDHIMERDPDVPVYFHPPPEAGMGSSISKTGDQPCASMHAALCGPAPNRYKEAETPSPISVPSLQAAPASSPTMRTIFILSRKVFVHALETLDLRVPAKPACDQGDVALSEPRAVSRPSQTSQTSFRIRAIVTNMVQGTSGLLVCPRCDCWSKQ